jgi:hypothetical protein
MATPPNSPNLPDVSQLDFGADGKDFDTMSNEECKRFLEVWFSQGNALAGVISLALQMQSLTAGAEAAKWATEGVAADTQLGRLRRMMDVFRADNSTIKPPTPATVQKVSDLAKVVGTLQASQAKAEAIAAAIASVFTAADKVFNAAEPVPT